MSYPASLKHGRQFFIRKCRSLKVVTLPPLESPHCSWNWNCSLELSEPHTSLIWCGESGLLERALLASCHTFVEPVFLIFTISYFFQSKFPFTWKTHRQVCIWCFKLCMQSFWKNFVRKSKAETKNPNDTPKVKSICLQNQTYFIY